MSLYVVVVRDTRNPGVLVKIIGPFGDRILAQALARGLCDNGSVNQYQEASAYSLQSTGA